MVLFLEKKKNKGGGFPQSILIFLSILFTNPGFLKFLVFSNTALHNETWNQKPHGTHMSV